MAKGKKSKSSGAISNGGRQKRNVAHEQTRQARFARRREDGKVYEYKPNPYTPGTEEWYEENAARKEKAKSSRLPYARLQSWFAKLDNELNKKKLEMKASQKVVRK